MSVCPNKNAPEWKALVAEVGEFEAFRDFMEYNGEIRKPREVAHKLAVRARNIPENYQKERTNSAGVPTAVTVLETLAGDLAAKFGDEYGYRFVDDSSLPWKGKVEAPNRENGGKRTIVINSAKATLDTPLHEFGHIFLDMIKNENPRLHAELVRKLPKSKEGRAELALIQKYYPELDDVEAIEETIVELMGKYAAGTLKPKTTLYKLLKEAWDTIVKAVGDMIASNTRTTIRAVDISYNTSIETLAELLAIKDLKFEAGTEVKEEAEMSAMAADKRIRGVKKEIEDIKALDIDNPDQVNDPESLVSYFDGSDMHAVTRRGLEAIHNTGSVWSQLREYIKGEGFLEDSKAVVSAMIELPSTMSAEDKLSDIRLRGEFPNWFTVIAGVPRATVDKFLKNVKEDPKGLWPAGALYETSKTDLEYFSNLSTQSALSSAMRGSERFFTKIFPDIKSFYTVDTRYNRTVGQMSDMVEVLDKLVERLEYERESGTLREKSVSDIEVVLDNEGTGKAEA